MSRHSNKPGLSTVITIGLAVLIVPVLVFILWFGHYKNSKAIHNMLEERIARSQENSIKATKNLIHPVLGTVKIVAEVVETDPNFFRTEASRELLYQSLTSAEQIDGFHVSFEDGYFRAVTRIDAGRRRSDPRIPAEANWLSANLDADGPARRHHRLLFDTWPNVIDRLDEELDYDGRKLAHYKRTKETGRVMIGDPYISPITGSPIMSVCVPIVRNGEFLGIVDASITLNVLSQFLEDNRVSKNSLTLIAHQDGRIIVHPNPEKGLRRTKNAVEFVTLAESDDSRIREAVRQRKGESEQNNFRFTASTGEELSISFRDFPQEFGRRWQVVVITPTDDFVGELKRTNQTIAVVIFFLLMLELLLIYLLARGLSRGLENASRQLEAIQQLKFIDTEVSPSNIREVADLQGGFSLLRNALKTFAQYVPLDIVRQLVESGQSLGLGVEARALTIFFCDLENFSGHAEEMAPQDLLRQLSEYFSTVTEAIAVEHGTVDKFIGDAVMAFWGAPLPREDHVLRACAGAMRVARRMEKLNQEWSRQGRPTIRVRIGLNTATVLVGNVGSAERFSYTVIGDGVNVASRLEGQNKEFGSTICISDSVYEAVCDRIVARPLGRVVVKGRQREFMIYELLGLKDTDDPELLPCAGELEMAECAKQAGTALAAGEERCQEA